MVGGNERLGYIHIFNVDRFRDFPEKNKTRSAFLKRLNRFNAAWETFLTSYHGQIFPFAAKITDFISFKFFPCKKYLLKYFHPPSGIEKILLMINLVIFTKWRKKKN